jgi:hypothetical protein
MDRDDFSLVVLLMFWVVGGILFLGGLVATAPGWCLIGALLLCAAFLGGNGK